MRRHLGFICRATVVALLLFTCVSWLGGVFEIKSHLGVDIEAITDVKFYDLPKDSTDVLFIGSSHSLEAFLPQELYNSYGIASYNLSSGQQPLIVSYFWLEEALKTQSPTAIVFDVYSIITRAGKESEIMIHKSLDHMRWGLTKAKAVNAVRKNYHYSRTEYYLPNIRYHDRWKELEKWDFALEEMLSEYKLMEYASAYPRGNNPRKYVPYEGGSSSKEWKMPALAREYLEKTVALCAKNNIKLIFVKTPTTAFDIEKHNTMKRFATEHGLTFYDMNERKLHEETGIVFSQDIYDYGHANYYGGLKMTHYIGKLLQNEYGLKPHKSEFWEMTKIEGENFVADYKLKETTDFEKYLAMLNDGKSRYTILISARDDASKSLGAEAQAVLKSLGLKNDWKNVYRKSYIAVIENGKVLYEKMSDKKLTRRCAFDKKRFICEIESAGYDCGNRVSIKIDGAEKSKNRRGMNIVVFSNDRHIVIDSVCFDTNAKDNKCYR